MAKRPRGKALGMAALARELGISRQRLWQIMQAKEGKCMKCQDPSVKHGLCSKHYMQNLLLHRKNQRNSGGYKPWRPGGRGRPPIEVTA